MLLYSLGSWYNIMIYTDELRERLIDIKMWKHDLKGAEELRDRWVMLAKDILDNYKVEPKFEAKERIIQYSKDLVYNSILCTEK